MIYYVMVVIVLKVLALGIALGQKEQEYTLRIFLNTLLNLPIYGRILGWW